MEILNSWKEIAAYLGRGVRTVQRWERDLGLPVHRPKGKDRSAVLAFPAEIDSWLHSTPVRSQAGGDMVGAGKGENSKPANGWKPANGGTRINIQQVRESCARSKTLMKAVYEAARRHQALAAGVCDSLRNLTNAQQEGAQRVPEVAAKSTDFLPKRVPSRQAQAAAVASGARGQLTGPDQPAASPATPQRLP